MYEDEYENKEYELSINKQKKFASKLLKATEDTSGVVAIGSNPTSDLSLALLFFFVKKFYQKGRKIKIWNMSSGTRFFEIQEEDNPVIFLYNINAEDDNRRLQDVRDLIFATNGRLRFIAFSGDNPLKFFCEKLRFQPTCYFYLMGHYKRIITE